MLWPSRRWLESALLGLFSKSSFAWVCLDSFSLAVLEAADLCSISLVFKHWIRAAHLGSGWVCGTPFSAHIPPLIKTKP